MNGQWLSINLPMPACLMAWNQLQCPPQSNLIPSADPFISLTSFAIQTGFLKSAKFHSKKRKSAKYWIWGNQWPLVQNIARSTVGEWWSQYQSQWWLIYSVDGLFISHLQQTCMWVAGGKFRGVLRSGAVAQPWTSPSANWPRRVIRT